MNKYNKEDKFLIINDKDLHIRFPEKKDKISLFLNLNKLSSEKTYIAVQGEKISKKETEDYLDRMISNIKDKKGIYLFLFYKDKLIGVSSLEKKIKIYEHIGKINIHLENSFRGKGLGYLLLKEILKKAKFLPKLKKITLEVFENNKAGIGLYKKLGFKEYGRLPKGIKWRNKYVDEILMYKDLK